jgi:hypothetical protein
MLFPPEIWSMIIKYRREHFKHRVKMFEGKLDLENYTWQSYQYKYGNSHHMFTITYCMFNDIRTCTVEHIRRGFKKFYSFEKTSNYIDNLRIKLNLFY